ncbi:unnamed protein product [Brachionus calyciflorus]|uniref:Ubiquitin-like protease family profile domain-containing protein n=1 Tax=Brachionus calyciflorus TaxID=104777 RepID=A0A813YND0_9BILA|nr:unnamed protein product [Brachionus calyciflorus]
MCPCTQIKRNCNNKSVRSKLNYTNDTKYKSNLIGKGYNRSQNLNVRTRIFSSQNKTGFNRDTAWDKSKSSQIGATSSKTPNRLDLSRIAQTKAPKLDFNLKVYSSQELKTDLYENYIRFEINPVVDKASNYEIRRSDLNDVVSGLKLNDLIVNFYLKIFCNSASNKKCAFVDSIIISKILNSHFRGMFKSLEKISITELSLLFCPLFLRGNHWALLLFDVKSKLIKYFDSIYSIDSCVVTKICSTLGKYVIKLNGCENLKISSETSYSKQQSNCTDCGVFTCLYAKYLAFGRTFDFKK